MLKNLINFINLTQFNLECWDGDPDKRPTIQEVVTMIKLQMNKLGYYYQHGIGTEKNEIKAFTLYKKAAEEGYIESICNLRYCYQYGIGVDKNDDDVFKWYLKSAEGGNHDAMKNLLLLVNK